MMVVPVILFERLGIRKTINRSIFLFRESWGDRIIGHLGMIIIPLLGLIAGLIVIIPIDLTLRRFISLSAEDTRYLWYAFGAVYMVFLVNLMSAVNAVLNASLYYCAIEKKTPPIFDEGLIEEIIGGY